MQLTAYVLDLTSLFHAKAESGGRECAGPPPQKSFTILKKRLDLRVGAMLSMRCGRRAAHDALDHTDDAGAGVRLAD